MMIKQQQSCEEIDEEQADKEVDDRLQDKGKQVAPPEHREEDDVELQTTIVESLEDLAAKVATTSTGLSQLKASSSMVQDPSPQLEESTTLVPDSTLQPEV